MEQTKGINKRALRIKILNLQDQHCNGCEHQYKASHCLYNCAVGKQINKLGTALGGTYVADQPKRRTKAEWDVLCAKALIMKEHGMTNVQIAKKLEIRDPSYISEQLKKRNLR
ncbi:zinc-finger domain-containing protein [Bacillus thuringiensis]|uniref:zinc-finger domain-containing protein n=1 Tax=Bacillus thuringiensis TaxID=1428 RepID=UPI002AB42117|nr:zinc-finger domain-containing protein [Bacillus thuringiensis]MDY8165810.1 zinc-finger domain-containing protein [Bacillus thuringiensis]